MKIEFNQCRSIYKKAISVCHPDKNPHLSSTAKLLNNAWQEKDFNVVVQIAVKLGVKEADELYGNQTEKKHPMEDPKPVHQVKGDLKRGKKTTLDDIVSVPNFEDILMGFYVKAVSYIHPCLYVWHFLVSCFGFVLIALYALLFVSYLGGLPQYPAHPGEFLTSFILFIPSFASYLIWRHTTIKGLLSQYYIWIRIYQCYPVQFSIWGISPVFQIFYLYLLISENQGFVRSFQLAGNSVIY